MSIKNCRWTNMMKKATALVVAAVLSLTIMTVPSFAFAKTGSYTFSNTSDIELAIAAADVEELVKIADDGTKIVVAVDEAGKHVISESGTYQLSGSGSVPVVITGAGVEATVKVINANANATGTENSAISVVAGAHAQLVIVGNNELKGDVNCAGIQVSKDSLLVIEGVDEVSSLSAIGNGGVDYKNTTEQKTANSSNGAGIGGTKASPDAGSITVNGHGGNLTLSATGGGIGAAGIGSSYAGGASTIEINETTLSSMHGGCHNAEPEGSSEYLKTSLEGGPAIGGGTKGTAGGTVVIRDCTGSDIVGGGKSAGIGGGCWAVNSKVEIYGSTLEVEGGITGAAIGMGRVSTGCRADVLIKDSDIKAQGGTFGAGIGTGINASNDKLGVSDITIRNSIIEATGGAGSAGIGGGVRSYNVNVAIEGASDVEAYAGANYQAKYSTRYNGSPDTMTDQGIGQSGAAAIGRGAWGSVKFADYEVEAAPKLSISAASTVVAMSSGDNWAVAGFLDTEGVAATLLQTRFDRNYDLEGAGSEVASQKTNANLEACYLDGVAATDLVIRDADTLEAVATIHAPQLGTDYANGFSPENGRVGYYSFAITVPGAGTYKIGTFDNVRTSLLNGDESIASDDSRYHGAATYAAGEDELATYPCEGGAVTSYDRVYFYGQADVDPESKPDPDSDESGSDPADSLDSQSTQDPDPDPDDSQDSGDTADDSSSQQQGDTPSNTNPSSSSTVTSQSSNTSSSSSSTPKTGDPIAWPGLILIAGAAFALAVVAKKKSMI